MKGVVMVKKTVKEGSRRVTKKKKAVTPRRTGRPTRFTEKLADIICAEIAVGSSLKSVCEKRGRPAVSTVFNWLRQNEEFLAQYNLAKEEAADLFVEEIKEIADNKKGDMLQSYDGDTGEINMRPNNVAVQRAKLQIDARKWLASKLKPKKYGARLELDGETKQSGELVVKLVEFSQEIDGNSDSA
jgi:hypothetical protein